MTGYLRIVKESIPKADYSLFTSLDKFKVKSIFDRVKSDIFGFMQNEIDMLPQKYNVMAYKDKVKEWQAVCV